MIDINRLLEYPRLFTIHIASMQIACKQNNLTAAVGAARLLHDICESSLNEIDAIDLNEIAAVRAQNSLPTSIGQGWSLGSSWLERISITATVFCNCYEHLLSENTFSETDDFLSCVALFSHSLLPVEEMTAGLRVELGIILPKKLTGLSESKRETENETQQKISKNYSVRKTAWN